MRNCIREQRLATRRAVTTQAYDRLLPIQFFRVDRVKGGTWDIPWSTAPHILIPECSCRITELPDGKYCKKESRRSLKLASGYANALHISGLALTSTQPVGDAKPV
jgi:hypothetical protein